MSHPTARAALACASLLAPLCATTHASAHAIAGARVFPVTLTIDDPGVADEASLPTITYQRSGADGGPGPVQEIDLGFEYDKTITEDFGIGINDALILQDTEHGKTRTGFDDISVTGKYQAFVNAPHELIFSVGVVREFGRTGTSHVGADEFGGTTPTIYGGKGFGDLPIAALRPFAITGEFSYTIADKGLKIIQPGTSLASPVFNNGAPNAWAGGFSLQYSLPYLVAQVHDFPAPAVFKHLVPLVEVSWTSPATSPGGGSAQFTVAPGVIWIGDTFQVGLEALIPGNKASGSNVGVITQLHLFLDDILPNSLGKPLL